MIQLLLVFPRITALLGVWKAAWYGAGPEDQVLVRLLVIEDLRRPRVQCRWLVLHHGQPLLFGPGDQVTRVRQANAGVPPPGRPDHVKRAVRSLHDTRVAHQPGPDLRLQEAGAVLQGRPLQAVGARREVETVFAVAGEVGEQIALRCTLCREVSGGNDQESDGDEGEAAGKPSAGHAGW